MIAEFYIVPASFSHNENFTPKELENKINALADDVKIIKRNKDTNKLLVHPDIYTVHFLKDISVSDLVNDPVNGKKLLGRDAYQSLQRIVVESQQTNISIEEVMDVLLPEHNKDICHGLIAFHKIEDVSEEFQIIYDVKGWYAFRRHFLGLYPGTPDFFVDECIKYFPELFFHNRNRQTIDALLRDCPRKVIYHLAALNDKFRAIRATANHLTHALEILSRECGLDEIASLEGNAKRKDDLTFEFMNNLQKFERVCCEPHLKLCYNDNYPGDSSYSNDRRIYFHEGKENIQNAKILIGHIGQHL